MFLDSLAEHSKNQISGTWGRTKSVNQSLQCCQHLWSEHWMMKGNLLNYWCLILLLVNLNWFNMQHQPASANPACSCYVTDLQAQRAEQRSVADQQVAMMCYKYQSCSLYCWNKISWVRTAAGQHSEFCIKVLPKCCPGRPRPRAYPRAVCRWMTAAEQW